MAVSVVVKIVSEVLYSPLVATMTVAGVVLVVFLAVSASALPVDPQRRAGDLNVPGQQPVYVDEAGKLRRPRFPDTPGLDQDEYNRYWQEMVKENPGMNQQITSVLFNTTSCCSNAPLLSLAAMLEHLKGLDPEQLAQLHPRVSERMARASEGVRNRLEEARRLNVDELRELQRLAATTRKPTDTIQWNSSISSAVYTSSNRVFCGREVGGMLSSGPQRTA